MFKNETANVLWKLSQLFSEKAQFCSDKIEEQWRGGWDMQAIKALNAKVDAYNECSMEIMKIFPKYAFPENNDGNTIDNVNKN